MPQVIYNVTVCVEHPIEAEWLNWMKTIHIPEVMASNSFIEYKILKLVSEENPDSTTYAIQYLVSEIKNFVNYTENYAPSLQKKVADRYGERVLAFRTLLEVIE